MDAWPKPAICTQPWSNASVINRHFPNLTAFRAPEAAGAEFIERRLLVRVTPTTWSSPVTAVKMATQVGERGGEMWD
jgi:hypothetical protein